MSQALKRADQNAQAQKKRLVDAYKLDKTGKTDPEEPQVLKQLQDQQMQGQFKN